MSELNDEIRKQLVGYAEDVKYLEEKEYPEDMKEQYLNKLTGRYVVYIGIVTDNYYGRQKQPSKG